ncbi:MAG: response regulator transcription factor [Kofleriaceae bacterium]
MLVVDDKEFVRITLKRSLARRFSVVTAADLPEAVAASQTHAFDVAIVDLCLEHSSGLEVIRMLKAAQPDILAVLMSGYFNNSTSIEPKPDGPDITVGKLEEIEQTLDLIETRMKPMLEARRHTGATTTAGPTTTTAAVSLKQATTQHIVRVVAECDGNISQAARRLGVSRATVQRRLRNRQRDS